MKLRMNLFMTALLALSLIASVSAQMGRGGHGPGQPGIQQPGHAGHGGGMHMQLTDEQQKELEATVTSLHEQGATRQEIRAAVDALFAGWGIERPQPGDHANGPQLTDEQREQLHATVQGLRDQDAAPEEIHAAVKALFDEWGIDMPAHFPGRMGRMGQNGFGSPQLTDEQREQLHATVQGLRDQDAAPEEIHAAVKALFDEWGIDMPAHFPGRMGRMGQNGFGSPQLTDEQREQLHSTVQGLRDQDATREEIRAAVDALFTEWGIERPQHDQGHKGPAWMQNLTQEQRQSIRDMIRHMRTDGASRQEIHDAVQKQLQEWGVDGDAGGQGLLQKNDGTLKASNAPNPFNPTTTITYTLKQDGPVSVKVYNTQGRLIRTLVNSEATEGTHQVTWNGLNDQGETVSSGLYFYKVVSNGEVLTERMTLMK